MGKVWKKLKTSLNQFSFPSCISPHNFLGPQTPFGLLVLGRLSGGASSSSSSDNGYSSWQSGKGEKWVRFYQNLEETENIS